MVGGDGGAEGTRGDLSLAPVRVGRGVDMRTVNRVTLLGALGQDAETKSTQSGVSVSSFSVATSRRWKDKRSDEWVEETDWHRVVLWRCENLAQYLTKGAKVYIEGRLQTRSYEDNTGTKRYVTEVIADSVILLGGKGGDGGRADTAARGGGDYPGDGDDCPF